MKEKTIFLSLGLILLLCTNCNKPLLPNLYDMGIQDTINVPDIRCVPFDSIIESVHFLPLETNDACLIKQIHNIKLNDSLIFINDDRCRILVFDMKGNYLRQIGAKGNGPEEYLEIKDFFLNKDTIEILDFRKIECYSISGKHLLRKKFKNLENLENNGVNNPFYFYKAPLGGYYLWEKRMNFSRMDFSFHSKKGPVKKEPVLYFLYHVDTDFNLIRTAFPAIHKVSTNTRKFISYHNRIIIDPIFGDPNIYQIDSVGNISIRYSLNFGDKTATPEKLSKLSGSEVADVANKYIVQIMDFAETNKWVHLTFYWKDLAYNLFYNKEKQLTYLLSPSRQYVGDDEIRFWYVDATYKEQMVYCVDPIWFLEERERLSKEIRHKYGLDDEKLKNVTEESNFIVAFYTLK